MKFGPRFEGKFTPSKRNPCLPCAVLNPKKPVTGRDVNKVARQFSLYAAGRLCPYCTGVDLANRPHGAKPMPPREPDGGWVCPHCMGSWTSEEFRNPRSNPLTHRERDNLDDSIRFMEGTRKEDAFAQGYVAGLKKCRYRFAKNPGGNDDAEYQRGWEEAQSSLKKDREAAFVAWRKYENEQRAAPTWRQMGWSDAIAEAWVARSLIWNPAASCPQQQLFGIALAVKRGELARSRVTPAARRLADTMTEAKLREFAATSGLNPDRRRVKPSDLPVKEVVTTCQTRTKRAPEENPTRLLVLNPGSIADRIVEIAEKKLGRKVTAAEKAKLDIAIREFKEFQGRDPRPDEVMPVNAPKGTPLFVSMIGKVEEIRYSIDVPSDRKGKWRHRAGDHGREGQRTKPAYLAAIPGEKRLNYTIVEPEGAKTYFKPSHGIMG